MQEIIDQARELGKQIAAHGRTKAFVEAAEAVHKDAEAQKLLKAYDEQANRVHKLEHEGKPIEVADKHKLADMQGTLAGNDKIKRMMKFQTDYLELMNRVNQAIEGAIAAGAEEPRK